MRRRIAITGGIGSGKSSVLQYIQTLGYPVFSCDETYKQVIQSPEYIQKISEVFPSAVENGQINRKQLASIVFECDEMRKKLNEIAHPLIMSRLYAEMDKTQQEFVFAEVPLFFEGEYENSFDAVIVVERTEEARIRSVCARDGVSIQEAQNRIRAQYRFYEWLQKEKVIPTFTIENDVDYDALKIATQETVQAIVKHFS